MKEKLKIKKGISLIVLVITIIVIIILAAAVILTVSNNNPVEKANKAVADNDEAVFKEEVTVEYSDIVLENNGKLPSNATELIQQRLNEKGLDGSRVEITKNGKIVINKYTPVIPVGFKYLEGTISTGYVIQSETDGNEFVWVPVDTMDEFVRESFDMATLPLYTEPFSYKGATADASETAEYNAMMKSVEKYHGFYIARYEASNNGSGVAQSKEGEAPWEGIKWGTSMTDLSGGVVEKARSVYPNNDKAEGSKYAVSTLPYGVEWDQTVRWLEKTYTRIVQDSSEYGNCGSGAAINTGSNPRFVTNNIYDMFGNVCEWTMEAYDADARVLRGDGYNSYGTSVSISSRGFDTTDGGNGVNGVTGFRLALYIK